MDSIQNDQKKKLVFAKVLFGVTAGAGIGLSILCFPFITPAFRKYCLPYVPATSVQVSNVLHFLPKNSKNKLLDIGSGDGRIVLAASKHGLISHGVEINYWLVLFSRLKSLYNGQYKTKFYHKNLWKFDIKPYDYLVIFGVEQMMQALETKILNEANLDCKIIVCRFPLPNSRPIQTVGTGVDSVWLYDKKSINKQL